MKQSRGGAGLEPIERDGYKFIPAKDVEHRTGIKSTTLHIWAKQGLTSNGWPFHVYRNDKGFHFVREDTVQRLEERFHFVPDNRPAGRITIGLTEDQSGYIPITGAHHLIEELAVISSQKLDDIVKRVVRGNALPGIILEVVVDPLHHDKRYASERSLRALAQAARGVKL